MDTILNEIREPSALIPIANRLESQLTALGTMNALAIAIRIHSPDVSCEIMDAALHSFSAGQPIPAFGTLAQAALDWVSLATTAERKNYLAAIWQSLSDEDQSAFWQFVQRKNAA